MFSNHTQIIDLLCVCSQITHTNDLLCVCSQITHTNDPLRVCSQITHTEASFKEVIKQPAKLSVLHLASRRFHVQSTVATDSK